MKKLILLILPILAIACTDEWLDQGFSYEIETRFEAQFSPEYNQYTFDSETIEFEFNEEMDHRSLTKMVGAELVELRLNLPEDAELTWNRFQTISISLIGSEGPTLIAYEPEIDENAGNEIVVPVVAKEDDIVNLLESNKGQWRIELEGRSKLDVEMVINMVSTIEVFAKPR